MLKRHILRFILISLTGCFKHNKLIPKAGCEELGWVCGKQGLQQLTRRIGVKRSCGSQQDGTS